MGVGDIVCWTTVVDGEPCNTILLPVSRPHMHLPDPPFSEKGETGTKTPDIT